MGVYLAKRVGVFVAVILVASTLNFFLPRISGINPIRERLLSEIDRGGYVPGADFQATLDAYEEKFGLDKPLVTQYRNYLVDLARGDFGISIYHYPRRTADLIREALPWSIALGGVTTALGFIIGTLAGALLGWPRAPRGLRYLFYPMLSLSAIPPYMLGLTLVFLLAFRFAWFPSFGAYSIATIPQWTDIGFLLDVGKHAILPALALILVAIGHWAIGMRGMMVTMQGEDYMSLAEFKGLRGSRIFFRYAVRNALLPQATHLLLSLGTVVSGLILIEVVFAYPGMGGLLALSVIHNDYFVLQGVVFIIIVTIAVATLILDVIYPLIDPRITYRRA